MSLQDWKRLTALAIVKATVEFEQEVSITSYGHPDGLTYHIMSVHSGRVWFHYGYDIESEFGEFTPIESLSSDDLVEIFSAETLEYLSRVVSYVQVEDLGLFAPHNLPTYVREEIPTQPAKLVLTPV